MPAPPPFEAHPEPGRVRASGELDMATAPLLRAAVDGDDPLEIDLREVTFIDSTGLALLIELCRERRSLTIRPSDAVVRIVELCGLRDQLPLRP